MLPLPGSPKTWSIVSIWQPLLDASEEALERLAKAPTMNHLERSDRADAIAPWLSAHGIADAWELAPDNSLRPDWIWSG